MFAELGPALPLFDRLRAATRTLHEDVEAMVPVLSSSFTSHHYRDFLVLLWGVHHPLEYRLRQVPELAAVLPDLERRWKSPLLAQDLAALNLCAGSLPLHQDWPVLEQLERALGCLYVLEGSTLGGQYLQRHFAKTSLPQPPHPLRFLTCYGSDTTRMWKAFQRHVLAVAASLDHDAVITGACETFAAIKTWFSRSTPAFERKACCR